MKTITEIAKKVKNKDLLNKCVSFMKLINSQYKNLKYDCNFWYKTLIINLYVKNEENNYNFIEIWFNKDSMLIKNIDVEIPQSSDKIIDEMRFFESCLNDKKLKYNVESLNYVNEIISMLKQESSLIIKDVYVKNEIHRLNMEF